MSDVCKQWYQDYKKKYEANVNLYNKEDTQEEFFKNVTGYGKNHCAWRYVRIHGAVERMGGMANFAHYVNTCAEEDYKAFRNLEARLKKAETLLVKINKTLDCTKDSSPSVKGGSLMHVEINNYVSKIKPEVEVEEKND